MLEHKKKPCIGEDCPGCSMCNGGKMSEGGAVEVGSGKRIPPDPDEGSHDGILSKALGLKDGGEVHEDAKEDHEMMDDEIHDMMGEELMSAIDAKDKKRIMESIETMVMSCMNKRMG